MWVLFEASIWLAVVVERGTTANSGAESETGTPFGVVPTARP